MFPKALVILSVFAAINSPVALLPVQAQRASQCPRVNNKDIKLLFVQWNNSLQTGSPKKVARNYAKDGVLLPTVSNQVRNTPAEIKDYFQKFLKLKPVGKIDEENIRIYCNIAINSGIYTFNLTQDGQVNKVQARYTFVYRKVGNKWLIIEHHSSAMPEKVN